MTSSSTTFDKAYERKREKERERARAFDAFLVTKSTYVLAPISGSIDTIRNVLLPPRKDRRRTGRTVGPRDPSVVPACVWGGTTRGEWGSSDPRPVFFFFDVPPHEPKPIGKHPFDAAAKKKKKHERFVGMDVEPSKEARLPSKEKIDPPVSTRVPKKARTGTSRNGARKEWSS